MSKFLEVTNRVLFHAYALVGLFLLFNFVAETINWHKFQYQVTIHQLEAQGMLERPTAKPKGQWN